MEIRRLDEATNQVKTAITNYVGDRQRIEKDERYAPTYKIQQIQQLDQSFAAKVADIQKSLRTFAEIELERAQKKAPQSFDYVKLAYYGMAVEQELAGLEDQEIINLCQTAVSVEKPAEYLSELFRQSRLLLRKSSLLPALEVLRQQALSQEEADKEKLEAAWPAITGAIDSLGDLAYHVRQRLLNEANRTPDTERFILSMLDSTFDNVKAALA